jgi:hypothetical protein
VAAVGEAGQVVGQRLIGQAPVRVDERVVELLHPQRGGDARLQLGGVEGLAQEIVGAGPQGGEQERRLVLGGEHDDGHGGEAVVGAQPRQDLQPAQAGQLVVEQDRVRTALRHERQRALAVGGGDDVVAALDELALEQGAHRVGVVDDEQEIRRAGSHLLCLTAFTA